MTLTIDTADRAPHLAQGERYRLAAAGPGLWRVLGPGGLIMGHLQTLALEHGSKYRARRFHAASGRLRDVGDFWSADEAVECLRLAK